MEKCSANKYAKNNANIDTKNDDKREDVPVPTNSSYINVNNISLESIKDAIPDVSKIPDIEDPWCLQSKPTIIKFEDVKKAQENIRPYIEKTHCDLSRLSKLLDMKIYIKNEYLHYTGSYKERGALNSILELTPKERESGIIAASAGNHAQAICYHGSKHDVKATVIMPVKAPLNKINKCRELGGNVIVLGKDLSESKKIALYVGVENGIQYINGYDHPNVLAGAGTVGLEIMEQHSDVDVIVIPVGGGGLIAGISTVMQKLKPSVTIIAVESERAKTFAESLKNGKATFSAVGPTLADGLAVPLIGFNSFESVKASGCNVKPILVKEGLIASAILKMLELDKCILEGAGAIGIAAVLSGQLDEYKDKKIVVIATGGNIDLTILTRCIDRGLIVERRLVKFTVTINDSPECFTEVIELVAELGAGIRDMEVERGWLVEDVFHIKLKLVCETKNLQHANELEKRFKEKYTCEFKHVSEQITIPPL